MIDVLISLWDQAPWIVWLILIYLPINLLGNVVDIAQSIWIWRRWQKKKRRSLEREARRFVLEQLHKEGKLKS